MNGKPDPRNEGNAQLIMLIKPLPATTQAIAPLPGQGSKNPITYDDSTSNGKEQIE